MSSHHPPTQTWSAPTTAQPATWTLALAGDWSGSAVLLLKPAPAALLEGAAQATLHATEMSALFFDTTRLHAWDGGLAAALLPLLAPLRRAGLRLQMDDLPQEIRSVLLLALPAASAASAASAATASATAATTAATTRATTQAAALARDTPARTVTALGQRVILSWQQAMLTAAFLGGVLLACVTSLRAALSPASNSPAGDMASRLNGRELVRQLDQAGPLSLPIVSLTAFLVGLMLAYMGGAQLERMGAKHYIADLVTVGMVRELAGLMTGMIMAGRVGSAFAAQLATMKAGEEIDALRALGVDPILHLVLPRLLAVVAMAPLLWAYASLMGALAGLVPATLVYGVPAAEYLHRCEAALTWTHVWIGVFKATVYAALLALAGCREGLMAGRDAQAVGVATTRAVVKGLVWIIAAATGTTIVFQSLGY